MEIISYITLVQEAQIKVMLKILTIGPDILKGRTYLDDFEASGLTMP